ncbi:MAG: cytochrome C oxidase subunit IV family protein [Candidatus Omnitrophica bacterium]|nr:cytochrome C oxidase subunit IV family protein [Candidatus Omnitrophota bacterium]
MTNAHISPAKYLWIWVWLAGLMLLSVLVSELALPKRTIVLGVLMLSTIKAVLVGLYYMHLRFDRRWLTFLALFPVLLIVLAAGLICSSRLVRL